MSACFESHEAELLTWIRQRRSSYDPLVQRLFEASRRITSEQFRRRLFSCYGSNWGWPCMKYADDVMSHAPYVGISERAMSGMLR